MASYQQPRFPRWALGVIGAVTLLAAAILVLAVVMGVRAGQNQYELRSRQQVGIALQSALDYRADGQLQLALQEYQRVLTLDPTNPTAQEGIQSLLALAAAGQPLAATVPGTGPIPPAPDAAVAQVTSTPANPAPPAGGTPVPVVPTVAVASVPTGVSSTDGVLRPAVAFPTAQGTPAQGTPTLGALT
ncbi:MAG: hypothetical protein ACRC1H_02700, partial [Caldilineaceae bacterium]